MNVLYINLIIKIIVKPNDSFIEKMKNACMIKKISFAQMVIEIL